MALEYDPVTDTWKESGAPALTSPAPEVATPPPPAPVSARSAEFAQAKAKEDAAAEEPGAPKQENPIARALTETGRALSRPVFHPMGFASDLANEVNAFGSYVASAGGLAPNPVSDWLGEHQIHPDERGDAEHPLSDIHLGIPQFEQAPAFDPTQVQTAADVPLARMVPFVQTAEDITTPEGRKHLLEHPEQVGVDIATLLYPTTKAKMHSAGVVPTVSEAVGGVASKAAEQIAKSPKGAEALVKLAESDFGQRFLRNMPTGRDTSQLAQAPRYAEQVASHKIEPLRQVWDTLDEAEKATVQEALATTGERPLDPRLGAAFDAVKEFSDADMLEKVSRRTSEGTKQMFAKQTELAIRKQAERAGIPPEVIDAQLAEWKSGITVDPETGFASVGATNPVPEFSKTWNAMIGDYNKRLIQHERNMRLYQVTDPNGVVQVYPFEQYRRLNKANKMLERGKITPGEHEAIWAKETPGRYVELMEQQAKAKGDLLARQRLYPGFGKKSMEHQAALVDEAMGTWLDLERQGANPVYVPSKALASASDEVSARSRPTTQTPGSLKKAGGEAEFGRERDPVVMFDLDQKALVLQEVTKRTVAEVYKSTGGMPYEQVLAEYQRRFNLSPEQADRMVIARKNAIDPSTGKVGPARPGKLLIDRDVAVAIEHYLGDMKGAGKTNPFMKFWTVPILWLSPRFHMNNVIGGAVMTGLKQGPAALFRYAKEATELARSGKMDYRIAGGSISAPGAGEAARFTRHEVQGNRLAHIWETMHSPKKLVEASRHANQFMDSFFRSVAYLAEYDKQLGKGAGSFAAREAAWRAASDVLQNWDRFSPFEKNVISQVIPFVSWQKTVLRAVSHEAIEHPLRTHLMVTLANDHEEEKGLPEEWRDKIALTDPDKNGKQYFLSTKGMNPYAGAGDILTLKGFLGSLAPYFQLPLNIMGVNTFSGGVPATISFWGATTVDNETGDQVLKPDWKPLWRVIPQLGALATAAGVLKMPPPDEPTPKGLMDWLDRYGSKLGLGPGIDYKSIEAAKAEVVEVVKRQAAAEVRAAKKAAKQEPEPVLVGTAAAPATPAPAKREYDPVSDTYK